MEEENGSIIEEQNQKSTSIWTKGGKEKDGKNKVSLKPKH